MTVSALGAGARGHGTAQVSTPAAHDVTLRDVETPLVREGKLGWTAGEVSPGREDEAVVAGSGGEAP